MRILLIAALTLSFACPAVYAGAEEEVDVVVRKSVNSILKVLKNTKTDQEFKKNAVMKIIDPLFDLKLMAYLTVKRHWKTFSKEEKKEFQKLFIAQMQASYFDKVDLLTDEEVQYEKPVVTKKKKVKMLMHIVAKDQSYDMLYKLYQKKNKKTKTKKWQVWDVELEGISVVKSYGSQYSQFLEKNSPGDLLKKMREKALKKPKATAADKKKADKKPEEKKSPKPEAKKEDQG